MLNFDCGIYTITAPSGKCYVGSARSFRERWGKHLSELRLRRHHCRGLQAAFDKYGEHSLTFAKVAIVPKADLLIREQEQIDARPPNTLYNSLRIAGSPLGYKHSPETKARVAAAKRLQTPETRAKISAALRGRKLPPEDIQRMRERATGYVHTDSARAKMSVARRGKPKSVAHAQAIANALKGRAHSPERIAAMLAGRRREPQKNNTSGYPGVYESKGKWRGRFVHKGVRYDLGTFATPEAAFEAVTTKRGLLNRA